MRAGYGPCREEIERFSNDYRRRDFFTQGEVGTPGGMGTMLGFNLTDLLMRTRPEGVSSHLHYCWVYRGQVIVKTNDHRRKGRWNIVDHGSGVNAGSKAERNRSAQRDREALHFEMPSIATSWDQLQEIITSCGAKAKECRA
jgi:hypothetical protein